MKFRAISADDAYRLAHKASAGDAEARAICRALVERCQDGCLSCDARFGETVG